MLSSCFHFGRGKREFIQKWQKKGRKTTRKEYAFIQRKTWRQKKEAGWEKFSNCKYRRWQTDRKSVWEGGGGRETEMAIDKDVSEIPDEDKGASLTKQTISILYFLIFLRFILHPLILFSSSPHLHTPQNQLHTRIKAGNFSSSRRLRQRLLLR